MIGNMREIFRENGRKMQSNRNKFLTLNEQRESYEKSQIGMQ